MKKGENKPVCSSSILIVEDEMIIAKDIERMLENFGYSVVGLAISGAQAIEKTEISRPDLVLMDIVLQGEMDGIRAAHQINSFCDIPIVFLTACGDIGTLEQMKSMYPLNYVPKPIIEDELLTVIDAALKKHTEESKDKIIGRYNKLRKGLEATIRVLASAIEMREPYVVGHQDRVSSLACTIAEEIDLSEKQIEGIKIAASIHDIGKIGVPTEILNKPGQLSKEEFDVITTHPKMGHDLVKDIEYPWPIAEILLQHHERLDGSGYPKGLGTSSIYLESKILAVADVVEAMSSPRPYRPAHSLQETLREISDKKNTLYDPYVVNSCVGLFERGFCH